MIRFALAPAVLAASLSFASAPSSGAADRFPLELTVRSEDGKGIEGVSVTVSLDSGEPFSVSGTTDRKGRFDADLPDFERAYRIHAEKEGLATVDQTVDFAGAGIEPGQTAEVGLTMAPPTPAYFYGLARDAIANDDLAGAIAQMERSVALDPSFFEGWRALGGLYLASERPADALAAAATALALDPDDGSSLRNRYDALAGLDRPDELGAALDDLVAHVRSTDTAVLVFNHGVDAMKREELGEAQRRFGQALEIDPQLHQAHSALAELRIGEAERIDNAEERNAKLAEAIASLDRALEITPRNFNAWERKVEILKAMGRSEEAAEVEERIAELRGDG